MKKLLLASLFTTALLGTVAHAEDAAGTQGAIAATTPVSYGASQSAADYRASKLMHLKVYSEDKKEIGKIEDVIIDANKVTYLIIEVGGFLGVHEKDVAVPVTSVSIVRDGSKVKASMKATKEELEKAPTYKYYSAK